MEDSVATPSCRHCATPVGKNRYGTGLCWRCYQTPEIRKKYPRTRNKFFLAETQDFNGGYELPDSPTTTIPGSEERLAVLAQRVRQQVSLTHPHDASFGSSL